MADTEGSGKPGVAASPGTSREGSNESYGPRAVRGMAWSMSGRLGAQAIQFGAGIALARMLSPEDFGLLAATYVITEFAVIFFELGISVYLVQVRELTEEDLSTAFWINAIGGLVFAGLIFALSPFIADLFNQPKLETIAPVVGLTFASHIGICQLAIMERQLRFREIAKTDLTCALVGFATSITLAGLGLGALALAIGPVVQALAFSAAMWMLVRTWRPKFTFSKSSTKAIWTYSKGLLGFNVIDYWGRSADSLLIGRLDGPTALGLYNRSFNFMLLPVLQVSSVLGRVMLPILSSIKDDHRRVIGAYRRAVQAANLMVIPVLIGVAACAPALVPFIWGDRWTPMVPLLMILCVAGLPQCVSASVIWIFKSQERTGALFLLGLVSSGTGIFLIAVGAYIDGTRGVAWAVLARAWLLAAPEVAWAGRMIGMRARDVLLDNAATVLIGSVMAAAVWMVPTWLDFDRDSPSTLGAQIAVGVAVYGGLILVFRRRLVLNVAELLRGRAA